MMDLQRCGTMSQWVGAVGVLTMLSACGGSGDSSTPALSAAEPVALAAQSSPQASTDLALLAAPQPQLLAVAAAEPAGQQPPAKVEASHQRQRDDMARAIVMAELDKARQRHALLLQQHQRQQDKPDDAQRKAALERAQRDIDSLQRELDRRPPASAQP